MDSLLGRFKLLLISLAGLLLSVFASLPADAQAVPWTKNDINSGSSGVFTYTAGSPPQYQIAGSGTGVGSVDDSFCYVSTPCTQSNYIQGKVVSQTNTGSGALAGFCIRDSVQTSYAYSYTLTVTPGSGIAFTRRYQGGGNSTIATASGTAPIWLRLARNGSAATGYTVSAYSSSTGTNWTLIGSAGEANT
ncbi:MAG: hypothetical protein K2X81_28715, partial [Candidatus Obscuribacterales bacterium]|nr:hypothetical protein [Candidatus Obscuribacterales bacterium]